MGVASQYFLKITPPNLNRKIQSRLSISFQLYLSLLPPTKSYVKALSPWLALRLGVSIHLSVLSCLSFSYLLFGDGEICLHTFIWRPLWSKGSFKATTLHHWHELVQRLRDDSTYRLLVFHRNLTNQLVNSQSGREGHNKCSLLLCIHGQWVKQNRHKRFRLMSQRMNHNKWLLMNELSWYHLLYQLTKLHYCCCNNL